MGQEGQSGRLEYSLPEIQQVADVLVNGKLALEVQCSPLSQKLLGDRSQGYRSQGYQVIWLLGEKLWLKERLTQCKGISILVKIWVSLFGNWISKGKF